MKHIDKRFSHAAGVFRVWPALLLLAASAGCHKAAPNKNAIDIEPSVRLFKPERRTLRHTVGQPGYIYAYEQTSMYPKVSGYIDRWLVDIGDSVKKGQLMAHIYVPELHARYDEKMAQVELDEVNVRVAEQMVEVAQEQVHVAVADVREARANIDKYKADVERWTSEVKRQSNVSVDGRSVINTQIIEESKRQLQLAIAARSASEAALSAAQARESARKVDLAKAKVDVEGARVKVKVAKASAAYQAALISYTDIRAPYDGFVVIRNANTDDFVERRYGDESAPRGGTADQANVRGTPIYVVARSDIVRVYVDVPEMQANYVHEGTKAHVRVQALNDADIEGTVTRTSWALNYRSRTLRAEIDLPNKNAKILPGMYAYGEVEIERRDALTVPLSAVIEIGNENTIYLHEQGKAVRTPVQTGLDDGKFVEVFRKKVKDKWDKINGDEEVILGDLAELRDGEKVKVSQDKSAENTNEKGKKSYKEKR
jgi:multidrug efflux pump subunit AcrA (membrane-fusion protein)